MDVGHTNCLDVLFILSRNLIQYLVHEWGKKGKSNWQKRFAVAMNGT